MRIIAKILLICSLIFLFSNLGLADFIPPDVDAYTCDLWRFNDGSGITVSNAANASLSGQVDLTYWDWVFGQDNFIYALQSDLYNLNGLRLPYPSSSNCLNNQQFGSIDFWIKQGDKNNSWDVTNLDAGVNLAQVIEYNGTGIKFYMYKQAFPAEYVEADIVLNDTWVNLGFTWFGGNSNYTLSIYYNNTLLGQAYRPAVTGIGTNPQLFRIEVFNETGGTINIGETTFDEFRVSTIARTNFLNLPSAEVSFVSVESVTGCNLNIPVEDVTCEIDDLTCTTSSPNITELQVSNEPINAETVGGWTNGSLTSNPFKINPSGYDVRGTIPAHSETNIYQNTYYFYLLTTNLNEIDINTLNFSTDLSSGAITGYMDGLLYQYCEKMPDNNALNMRIDIYAGYNISHYKHAYVYCEGYEANYVPESFVAKEDLPKLNSDFNTEATQFNGTARILRTEVGLNKNTTEPIVFQTSTNRIFKNNLYIYWLNQSIGKTWNDFISDDGLRWSKFDEVVYLSYRYNYTEAATCSVGEILTGNKTYTCYAPPGNEYVFSENNDNEITKNVSIPPYTLIQVDLSRIRPLALGLTVIDDNDNPVINARCESPYSVNNTNTQGLCLLQNVPPETTFDITINPNNPSLPTVTTAIETGDYYNSQLTGDLGIPNSCSLFNGIFFHVIPIEELGREKVMKFIVYDLDVNPVAFEEAVQVLLNDQALFQEWFLRDFGFYDRDFARLREVLATYTVAGARISIDNLEEYSCTTNQQGTCSISWTPDLVNHNLTSSKYPSYLAYNEILPLRRFDGFVVFMRRNSTWWAENPYGEDIARGVDDSLAWIGVIFSNLFLAILVCMGGGILGTYYSGGNFFIGAFSFLALFFVMTLVGFIPFIFGLVFVIIAGGLMAFFMTRGFIGSGV